MNQQPACTIEPNIGIVEVPDIRLAAGRKKTKTNPSKHRASAKFCPRFVLEN
jgi:ribosome-binding ATPase YchF (GTP1/OBG family)